MLSKRSQPNEAVKCSVIEKIHSKIMLDVTSTDFDDAINNVTSDVFSSGSTDFDGFLSEFDLWNIYLKPSGKEWVLIFFYVLVFLVSLTGNVLSE